MPRRPRFLRAASWITLSISAGTLVLWLFSAANSFGQHHIQPCWGGRVGFYMYHGQFVLISLSDARKGPRISSMNLPSGNLPLRARMGFRWASRLSNPYMTVTAVPLWMPFLVFALPTGFLWYRRRQQPLGDHCPRCAYNLTGNISGRCPECGATTPTPATDAESRE